MRKDSSIWIEIVDVTDNLLIEMAGVDVKDRNHKTRDISSLMENWHYNRAREFTKEHTFLFFLVSPPKLVLNFFGQTCYVLRSRFPHDCNGCLQRVGRKQRQQPEVTRGRSQANTTGLQQSRGDKIFLEELGNWDIELGEKIQRNF